MFGGVCVGEGGGGGGELFCMYVCGRHEGECIK